MRYLPVVLAMVSACWTEVAAAPVAPPSVDRAVCRPTFTVDGSPLTAGTGFVLDLGGEQPRTLLVTAHHLFGPAGGLEVDIPWNELPGKVTDVVCKAFVGGSTWRAGRPLAVPNAAAGLPLDVAAFPFTPPTEDAPHRLTLASALPEPGDAVWLVAQLVGGAPRDRIRHRATVLEVSDERLVYRFDNPAMKITATSGAPVVNGAGEVVSINLGGGAVEGAVVGIGSALPAIRGALAAAKPAAP